ncbi:hypothetical protein [Actinoplanes sp. NPDC051411]|uniref:hypothetical protein n=1 Tax=Actinoplanes sp. NPDC051411 TaxID=3155522 RepID=UPI00343CD705
MLLSGDANNPILHVEELPRWPLQRPPAVPGAVHVYLSNTDTYAQPRGGLSLGEMWWRGPSRLYVIDVTAHPVDVAAEAVNPSTGMPVPVEISCTWQVGDAIQVVISGLVDVMVLLPPLLHHTLDAALAETSWDSPSALSRVLRSGLLPARVASNGLELTNLRATVVSVQDPELAAGDADD